MYVMVHFFRQNCYPEADMPSFYCTLYHTYFVNKTLDLEWPTIFEAKYAWYGVQYNDDVSVATFII